MRKLLIIGTLFVLLSFSTFYFIFSKASNNSNTVVNEMLKHLGISNCIISDVCNYNGIEIHEDIQTVNDKDVNEYIFTYLELYGERKEESEDIAIKKNNVAKINCTIYIGERCIGNFSNEMIKIGSGDFNSNIESALLGHYKNDSFIFSYYDELSNDEIVCNIDVISVYKIVPALLNDAFVAEHFQEKTVEEYRDSVVELLQNQKKLMLFLTEIVN